MQFSCTTDSGEADQAIGAGGSIVESKNDQETAAEMVNLQEMSHNLSYQVSDFKKWSGFEMVAVTISLGHYNY